MRANGWFHFWETSGEERDWRTRSTASIYGGRVVAGRIPAKEGSSIDRCGRNRGIYRLDMAEAAATILLGPARPKQEESLVSMEKGKGCPGGRTNH